MVVVTMSKEVFTLQQAEVIRKYQKLQLVWLNDIPILRGDVDIVDKSGKYWETYSIEVHHVDQFPNRFPLLFETSGKILRIADWHVYEDSGSCCVTVLPRELIACNQGISLLQYLDNYALPYLFNQTFRRIMGYYPSGEYAHGTAGIVEFYLELLRTDNIEQALRWMWQIAEGLKLSRVSNCFCGKKIKYRHCHREAVNSLRMIGRENVRKHVALIYSKLNPSA